ncbi:hypothetical protein Csa_021772 [Cucumis sativus]|uniref:Uncharacterized protein n=1 Tax=Cucumis sativus TaxID=3659 RepID=A0ACB6HAR4_CUCSA|nr:hypothetical protein CSA_004594 [Cucumis sativus]KAE8647145.1 hypothetical protein Csa_021772 [Cucumis sativus]
MNKKLSKVSLGEADFQLFYAFVVDNGDGEIALTGIRDSHPVFSTHRLKFRLPQIITSTPQRRRLLRHWIQVHLPALPPTLSLSPYSSSRVFFRLASTFLTSIGVLLLKLEATILLGCSGPRMSKGQGRAREIKVFPGEELPNDNQHSRPFEEGMMNSDSGEGLKNLKKSAKSLRKEKQGIEGLHGPEEPNFPSEESENCDGNNGGSSVGEQYKGSSGDKDQVQVDGSFSFFLNGEHIRSVMANLNFSDNFGEKFCGIYVINI